VADWHLKDLRATLERRGWRFSGELPGDDRAISATWSFERSGNGLTKLLVDFDGLDDLQVLPLSESYACRARGTEFSLYFRRRGHNDPAARDRWVSELDAFVNAIDSANAV
jgi:hypothetical protein